MPVCVVGARSWWWWGDAGGSDWVSPQVRCLARRLSWQALSGARTVVLSVRVRPVLLGF